MSGGGRRHKNKMETAELVAMERERKRARGDVVAEVEPAAAAAAAAAPAPQAVDPYAAWRGADGSLDYDAFTSNNCDADDVRAVQWGPGPASLRVFFRECSGDGFHASKANRSAALKPYLKDGGAASGGKSKWIVCGSSGAAEPGVGWAFRRKDVSLTYRRGSHVVVQFKRMKEEDEVVVRYASGAAAHDAYHERRPRE